MKVPQTRGVTRGKSVRTTRSSKADTPLDRVNRQFVAECPDLLWVADFTYVSTWQGFAYVAFIIDVFAGVIVGWPVSSTMETSFVLALMVRHYLKKRLNFLTMNVVFIQQAQTHHIRHDGCRATLILMSKSIDIEHTGFCQRNQLLLFNFLTHDSLHSIYCRDTDRVYSLHG